MLMASLIENRNVRVVWMNVCIKQNKSENYFLNVLIFAVQYEQGRIYTLDHQPGGLVYQTNWV